MLKNLKNLSRVFSRNSKGFTLIELMVVIAIIAILAVLIILNLNTARKKARDAVRKSDMSQMQTAIESYADDHNGAFPNLSCTTNSAICIFKKSNEYTGLYLQKDVADPKAGRTYRYSSNGQTYKVCADLEINNPAGGYCISTQ